MLTHYIVTYGWNIKDEGHKFKFDVTQKNKRRRLLKILYCCTHKIETNVNVFNNAYERYNRLRIKTLTRTVRINYESINFNSPWVKTRQLERTPSVPFESDRPMLSRSFVNSPDLDQIRSDLRSEPREGSEIGTRVCKTNRTSPVPSFVDGRRQSLHRAALLGHASSDCQ